MKKVILKNPFDAHIHWRILQTLMRQVAQYTMRQFSGGLLMPNTGVPDVFSNIFKKENLKAYGNQVSKVATGKNFLSMLTYFLSSDLTDEDFIFALGDEFQEGCFGFAGVKYYPKGGTTNSDKGMNGFSEVTHVLDNMQKRKIPILIHGEVALDKNNNVIDDFYREQVFYEEEMENLVKMFPELLIVMEHITTSEAADFVMRHDNVRATITPQHILFNRTALFNGPIATEIGYKIDHNKNGMNPTQMCRPILKAEKHVQALRSALKKQYELGLKKFGLGTDSAPHTAEKKYCECGACGVYSAPIALELYAMAFYEMGILDHLPKFAGEVMPEFYGIKDRLPQKTVELILDSVDGTHVQSNYDGVITPFAGQILPWRVLY